MIVAIYFTSRHDTIEGVDRAVCSAPHSMSIECFKVRLHK